MTEEQGRRRGRGLSRTIRAALLIALCVALAGCTDPIAEPDDPIAQAIDTQPSVPEVPVPTEPERPTLPPGLPPATPNNSDMGAVSPGDTVLVHLEGPLGNREATDVVVRTPDGTEVDRFRLPGAVGVWASPSSAHALIYTLPDGWARYDAVSATLSTVTFPGQIPGPTVRAGSGVAGPTALWDPQDVRLLLRMDTGTVNDLEGISGDVRLDVMTGTGEQGLLATDNGPALLTTATGEVRPLGVAAASISRNALTLATLGPPAEEREIAVQAIDGSDRRVLGTTTTATNVHALPDGRVLLLGPAPGVMGTDGEVQPLEPALSIGRPVRVSADDRMALVSTGGGLALLDLIALTLQPLPDTDGFVPYALGPATLLWALSVNPQQPGGLVVDPSTGTVTRFSDDRPTERFLSITADGRRVSLTAGGDRVSSLVVDADGTVTTVDDEAGRVEVVLHPAGDTAVTARIGRTDQSLTIGPLDGPVVEVPTGRNPVWLSTLPPDARLVPLEGPPGAPVGRPGG